MASNVAGKDDNSAPVIFGVSHIDGRTPVQVQFNPITRAMKVDFLTVIGFNPIINASQTDNDFPIAKATSSSDDRTVKPWVVNASTGAVLVAL